MSPPPVTFGLLTLKVVSETRVTSATSVPVLVFRGLRRCQFYSDFIDIMYLYFFYVYICPSVCLIG